LMVIGVTKEPICAKHRQWFIERLLNNLTLITIYTT
jgi:hypothetical protein